MNQISIPTLYLLIFLSAHTILVFISLSFYERMYMSVFYYCIYLSLLFVGLSVDNFKSVSFIFHMQYSSLQ